MRIKQTSLILFILVVFVASLPAQRRRSGGEMVEVDAATAATIKGEVRITSKPPGPKPIRMDADPVCKGAHEGLVLDQVVKTNDKGRIAEAFVFISKGLEGKTFPESDTTPVLDQVGCLYEPQVLGIRSRQELVIKNSDPTLHNVHAIDTNDKDVFNLAMAQAGMVIKQEFRNPSVMVKVKCDVHPWMFSYVGVVDHPYFAVTDEDGAFEIPNVPPGDYTVTVWQRKLGFMSADFSVGEKQTAELDFKYSK